MENQRPARTSHDIHPPTTGFGALDPALRQALMRVNPEYFAWSIEAQERYRVSMPEQDAFRLRQELVKALFGLHAKTDEDLSRISDQFGDQEHLVFNRVLLPATGVGEDYFFLNEYLDKGKTLLDFDTLYAYDYDDHCFQEQARKEQTPEYVVKPYRGALYYAWARVFIDGVFHYASLCMAAGYVYSRIKEFGQEKVSTLIPHRYVNAKDHGKREGKGTIFSQRIDADGKEVQAEELLRRFWDYLSQRYDALCTEFNGEARKAVYMEDLSRHNDPHMTFIFSDKTALQAVRFRQFMRDCRPLVGDRVELDVVINRERQALDGYLESTCRDILANFDPKVAPLRKKHKIIIADGALNDVL
ncbi:MAG: hypothetical protein CV088_20505 [Nitrospira sp. LK70]|nr:hypothetical protein [Nitrospira sp. LK70]